MQGNKDLEQFKNEMEAVLNAHQENKGDSWKTCSIEFLEQKLKEEVWEYTHEENDLNRAKEAVDIANICMMLYHRRFRLWVKSGVRLG